MTLRLPTRTLRTILLIVAAPALTVSFLVRVFLSRHARGTRGVSAVVGCILGLAGAYSLRAHWGAPPRPLIVEWALPILVASFVGWFLLYVIDLRSSRIGGLRD
jgi:hypothetical protein